MQSPPKVYTKRLHINSMIKKNNLEKNQYKQIENQNNTNHIQDEEKKHTKRQQTLDIDNQKSKGRNRKNRSQQERYQSQKDDQFEKQQITKQKRLKQKQRESRQNKMDHQSLRQKNSPSSQKLVELKKIKIPSSLSMKYKKRVILLHQNPSVSEFQSIKVVKVLDLYPKKESKILRCKKATAMQKYDYLSQNMRLAQKLLKMKPTRPCDKKEQHKFFKKQEYFKQLRSYSTNCQQCLDRSQVKLISQSSSLPKINKRRHTIQC